MITNFMDYICKLLKEAVERDDVELARAVNVLFHRMELDFIDYNEVISGFMAEFTGDAIRAIEQRVDKDVILAKIEDLRQHPEETKSYYALSHYVEYPERKKLEVESFASLISTSSVCC